VTSTGQRPATTETATISTVKTEHTVAHSYGRSEGNVRNGK
jgi:hypothetical protein